MDSGVTRKLIETWQPETSVCKSLDVQPLTLTHVFTAFLLIGGGLVLSLIIMVGEILYKNLQESGGVTKREINGITGDNEIKMMREGGINNDGLRTTNRITWVDRTRFKKCV